MRPAALLSIPALATLGLLTQTPACSAGLGPQIASARKLTETGAVSHSTLTKHYVEVSPGVFVAVKGAKERRQVRFARWIESLTGDRREIYEREGFPYHRHLENSAGIRTEHWSYPERGLTFVFRGGTLVDTRSF